jgi:hypothetical protein
MWDSVVAPKRRSKENLHASDHAGLYADRHLACFRRNNGSTPKPSAANVMLAGSGMPAAVKFALTLPTPRLKSSVVHLREAELEVPARAHKHRDVEHIGGVGMRVRASVGDEKEILGRSRASVEGRSSRSPDIEPSLLVGTVSKIETDRVHNVPP